MADKRKNITKKMRFEVFKRDSFTCQYCGRMAPDVVLEVDHINPVDNDGNNDILNLVTSCFDCNRGKGKRLLTEKDVMKKQQDQLKELSEKREQLEMMIQWKKELSKFEDEQVEKCNELLSEYESNLSDFGRGKFKKWIKKYGFLDVYETFQISLDQYAEKDNAESIGKAINYVPRIISVKKREKNNPMLGKNHYIKGILRNRGMLYNERRVYAFLNEMCVDEVDFEMIKDIACNCRNWTQFWEWVNDEWEGDW